MTLKDAIGKGEFVVTCEFIPGRGRLGTAMDGAASFARQMADAPMKIHAVSLTDNPGGMPAIMPDVIAAEVQREGMEALVHFTCRDMNRNAMESRAMGLARVGIKNLLVLTGDYTRSAYEGLAPSVFDMDSVQAVRYLKAMNAGLEVPGRKLGTSETLAPTDFLVGVAVSPFKRTESEVMAQFFKLERKIQAGADFVVTQMGYDVRKFLEVRRYLASRGLNIPVIAGVFVLSLGAARSIAEGHIPGCVVTEELLKVLEKEAQSADKGLASRLERAAKMVAIFKGSGFAGVHLGGFHLKPEDIFHILQRAEELKHQWESFIPEFSFSHPNSFYAFPPPETYRLDKPDPDPLVQRDTSKTPFGYRISHWLHNLMFEPEAVLAKALRAYFKDLPEEGLRYALASRLEYRVKQALFDCRRCGDCALPDTAYLCPMSQCPKHQRNGPCGGSRDGWCEVYPNERSCLWTRIYERLKAAGGLEQMRTGSIPPRNAALQGLVRHAQDTHIALWKKGVKLSLALSREEKKIRKKKR